MHEKDEVGVNEPCGQGIPKYLQEKPPLKPSTGRSPGNHKLEEIRGNEDRAVDHLHGIRCRLDEILSRNRGAVPLTAEAAEEESPQGIVFEIIGKQEKVCELIISIEEKLSELEELL